MWKRYLSPTPANVARLLIAIKTVLMTIAGATFISGDPKVAFYIAVATGVLNEAASFLTHKEKKNTDNTN